MVKILSIALFHVEYREKCVERKLFGYITWKMYLRLQTKKSCKSTDVCSICLPNDGALS